jgi:hypothetical protein
MSVVVSFDAYSPKSANYRLSGFPGVKLYPPYNCGMEMEPSKGIAPLNRPLSDQESELLTWLLEHGFRGAQELVSQIPKLTVVGICTCGCPTIYFAFDGVPVKRKGEQLISDYIAELDGHQMGLMVFQTDGLLSSMEVYSLPGLKEPFGLPPVSSIVGAVEDSQ